MKSLNSYAKENPDSFANHPLDQSSRNRLLRIEKKRERIREKVRLMLFEGKVTVVRKCDMELMQSVVNEYKS